MNRFLYFAGFAYIALYGAIVVRELEIGQRGTSSGVEIVAPPPAPPTPRGAGATTSGAQWFAAMKPFCNPVEVEVRTRFTPAPQTSEGAGYAAACFALAGKIDRARGIINGMRDGDRGAAANVLFNVAHPVADAGDDLASGAMMALVLEYWPNNYMALYHAGMSEYALAQYAAGERHLRLFLEMYTAADGFTENARQALGRMRSEKPSEGLRLRPLVERDGAARP